MISKETRNILILSLLLVIIWIIVEIYHIRTQSNVEPDYKSNLTPINADIDMDTLNSLKNRISLEN